MKTYGTPVVRYDPQQVQARGQAVKTYRMPLACFNCGHARPGNSWYVIWVDIPKGKKPEEVPCPHCGVVGDLMHLKSNHQNPYPIERRYGLMPPPPQEDEE